ncbi:MULTISPECIES: CoA transferase [Arthrobacter]|uniref:CoA transferase n=2 Tax=Arthrobacter TaxID=1663 RepID=A0ABU9KMQ0_9MICC|nr:CoA transferase [Arthrobacter sp. YJM1]MDP5226949.1 CoA transferase [Arthrobacter sp. YJM1]
MQTTTQTIRRILDAVGGDPDSVEHLVLTGPDAVLPSAFPVTSLATSAVAAANLGLAAVLRRAASPGNATAGHPRVSVDRAQASAAFLSEAVFTPQGWDLPSPWDPLSGVYRSRDGWIRLHTNYGAHRAAATAALGLAPDATREEVAEHVLAVPGVELESAVLRAGGAAAVLHSRLGWLESVAGSATAQEPAVHAVVEGTSAWTPVPGGRPLEGLRALDLTRVIAGPLCTRFLAAHGADVLRLDPPGFQEVPALLPVTTQGKRRAFLDLASPAGRERFLGLLSRAHVLVHGLRPGALEALGLDQGLLRAVAPGLVVARLDAYGWHGPWARRRGFDSLVQMSCGIADDGSRAAASDAPHPLPAQALDHSTGYHLAAGVLSLLGRGAAGTVTASLVGAANLLYSMGPGGVPAVASQAELRALLDGLREPVNTAWGDALAVPVPGTVDGAPVAFAHDAGPLGVDDAVWP